MTAVEKIENAAYCISTFGSCPKIAVIKRTFTTSIHSFSKEAEGP